MKLVIFDLDQTLVDFIPVHDRATQELFQRAFGVDARLTEIDFAGRSLTDNFAELAALKGISEDRFRVRVRDIIGQYETLFARDLPREASRYVLPGVEPLLTELSKTDHVVALYTGDSPGIVASVFAATGLGKYFRFHLCGTQTETRAEMVKLAVERAEGLTGRKFAGKDIVIVGDSVRDIDCGKQFGAMTIAVATGYDSKDKLAGKEPDYLFDSLEDYRKVLNAIG